MLEKILCISDSFEAVNIDISDICASCSVENVRIARALANICIDDRGNLQFEILRRAETLLKQSAHSIAYGAEDRRRRYNKFLSAVNTLLTNVEAQRIFKRISRPVTNRLAEKAIKDTLLLPEDDPVTDVHAKKSVLCAFLTTLRQSLGSCFATAPAIIVQELEPILFLNDIESLMETGQLKRVISGNEYGVPMCASYGNGDLKKTIEIKLPLYESRSKIFRSPILLALFKKYALLPSEVTGEDGYFALAKLLEKIFSQEYSSGDVFYTNVEEIFEKVLQKHVGVLPQEVRKAEDRPKEMMQQGVVLTQKRTPEKSDLAKRIKQYQVLLSSLKREFIAQADCALLKMWEFTVASFAEVKFDVARYNFYASLGVNWDDAGGIGEVLYEIAKRRVDEAQLQLQEYQQKLDAINFEVDTIVRRMQQTSVESEMQFLKMEYQTRQMEQHQIKEEWERISERVQKVAHIHQFLIDQYDRLLKEYFQEIYDPDLHDVAQGQFDDSPAGFRLIYKHGRTNPSLWTKVASHQEYVDALVSFITITEQELMHAPEIKGIEQEFSSIITRLTSHIRSDQFLESALQRMAQAHGGRLVRDPLKHLEQVEKKPWVYTSGGSLNTLVSSYFNLLDMPEEKGRFVENEEELLAFCIDTARLAAMRSKRSVVPSILMHSPTHAFSMIPAIVPFQEAIESDAYSYTWIRNMLKDPYQLYYSSCTMDGPSIFEFCKTLSEYLPASIRVRFLNEAPLLPSFLRPFDLGKEIHKLFEQDYVLRRYQKSLSAIGLDTLLFTQPPYTAVPEIYDTMNSVLKQVLPKESESEEADTVLRALRATIDSPISAKELRRKILSACMMLLKQYTFSFDMLEKIVSVLREKRLLPPMPIIFADSNWVSDYFAFVVGPTSMQIELWSVNAYGTEGSPIPHWQQWLNGSRRDRTWGLLIDTRQYLRFIDFVQDKTFLRT